MSPQLSQVWGPGQDILTIIFYEKSCFPHYSSLSCFQIVKSRDSQTLGISALKASARTSLEHLLKCGVSGKDGGPRKGQGQGPRQLRASLDPWHLLPLLSCFFLPWHVWPVDSRAAGVPLSATLRAAGPGLVTHLGKGSEAPGLGWVGLGADARAKEGLFPAESPGFTCGEKVPGERRSSIFLTCLRKAQAVGVCP